MCDNFVGDYFSFIDCFTQCAQRAHEMLSALSPYLCSLQQLVSSDLQFHMPYNIHLNLFYLSSCQALENCHRFHQKNPANPNCALLQRSRLESRRGANGTGVPTIHKRRKALLLNPKHKVSNEYQTGKGGLTWMPAPSGTVIFQAQFRQLAYGSGYPGERIVPLRPVSTPPQGTENSETESDSDINGEFKPTLVSDDE